MIRKECRLFAVDIVVPNLCFKEFWHVLVDEGHRPSNKNLPVVVLEGCSIFAWRRMSHSMHRNIKLVDIALIRKA